MSFGALLLAVALVSGNPASQLQLASITAVVVDEHDQPVPAAILRLTDALGAELQRASTDAQGRATFSAVAPGRYYVAGTAPGVAPFEVPAQVTGAVHVELTVRVPSAVTSYVTVKGSPGDASTRDVLAAETLASLPIRARARGVQEALATLPGWSTEDNGLLHARGVDDGFLYVIDGVPVYERLDAVSGIAPDLASVASVNVITGYVPPEYGHKAGGAIEVRSGAAGTDWRGTADLAFGRFSAVDGSAAAGGRIGSKVDLRAGVASSRSDRFLDPSHPDNFHNTGGQSSTFGHFGWSPTSRDRITTGWGLGRSRFDVPNTELQEEAGQDQRQHLTQRYINATWQRTLGTQSVLHAAAYARHSRSRLDGSDHDTPLEAHADRTLGRGGVLLAATRQQRDHLFKAGLEWQSLALAETFAFAVTDQEVAEDAGFRDEALEFTPDNPFRFEGTENPAILSLYLQDTWQVASALTLSGGVRYDRSRLLLERSQWSPRLGVALRVSPTTVLRGAASRFFQPPQPENLLLSSSPEARVLSGIEVGDAVGGADVEPERQWGVEAGVDQALGRHLRLDASYWQRWIENAADPNVFAGTTIIFPNAVAKGRARGFDVRLDLPRFRGWSAYGNWSYARVIQTGPVTGGLFLEDEVEELGPGVEFFPDHDQRVAAGGGVTWQADSGLMASLTARYESGTPIQREGDDDELEDLPGAETVDFEEGRVRPRTVVSLLFSAPVLRSGSTTVTAGAQVVNLFDDFYAYNFGNPFSGTHFGAPRSFAVTLRVAFGQ